MCCIAEIAMTVFGIVTLVKGRFMLSRSRVVTGAPAYIIGTLLTAVIPVAFAIGFVAGVIIVSQSGQPSDLGALAAVDFILVPLILVVALVVAVTTAKNPDQRWDDAPLDAGGPMSFPPADPNNPYEAPYSDGPQPPRGE